MGEVVASDAGSAPPRPRGRPPSATRRREMLDVAAAMFARDGYHGTSMRALAERAGVNPASLYHYFRSKEEALLQVCLTGIRDSADRLDALLGSPAPMAARIRRFVAENIADLEDHADYRHVYYEQREHLSVDQRATIDHETRRVRRLLDRLFEEARVQDELHATLDARQASLATASMMQAITRYYISGPIRDFRHVADGMTETLIRGLQPRLPVRE